MKSTPYLNFIPLNILRLTAGLAILAALLVTGCKHKSAIGAIRAGGYFQTSFQNESEFIVHAVVSDLAEQMYYAAKHQLPDVGSFLVTATEKPGSPPDEPVYSLKIRLDPKTPELNYEVTINGPIWSPQVYRDIATKLAQAVGLSASSSAAKADTTLLARLKDNTADSIERENQRLSSALEGDFANPELHEEASVLLGAFLLRDHSGFFLEIRSPLSRLTAHLIMAHFLSGSNSLGTNGRLAEAMMLTLVGDETPAITQLNDIGTNNPDTLPFVRALQARNTGDYRVLDKLDGLSEVESVQEFCARADYVSTPLAWTKLTDIQKQTIGYVRMANDSSYSVEIGHQLLAASIPLEMQEIQSVYTLSQGKKLTKSNFKEALNEMPDGCFGTSGTQVHVHVIGWGQWADFLQRHLCHAVQQNYYFMEYMWGVPDDAKEFAAKCEQQFDGLRLYPFVRRFNCNDVDSYHKSVDDGFKVTVATPQLVPADCWNYLCYKVNFAPLYNPNPNPHVNEWHNHNPPPGTIYNLRPRLNHPSLVDRPDAVARFQQLHELAPYDCRLDYFLLEHQYHNHASIEQASNLFKAALPYSLTAMRSVADTVYSNQPVQYEQLMLQAAAIDPTCYYDLGYFKFNLHQDDDAAKYYDQATAADPDSVRIASLSPWRVKYYLKHGQIDKARQIADFGAEVYSARGLAAEAYFFEATSNYDDAFQWYAKDEERYEDSSSLVSFCLRYKNLTGDTRFDSELKKREEKYFPGGIKRVSLTNLSGPPADGVAILEQNKLLNTAGLHKDDVIVALNGIQIHSFNQYSLIRGTLVGPEMDLIVWQNNSYHEIKASPPDYKFGVEFGDYPKP